MKLVISGASGDLGQRVIREITMLGVPAKQLILLTRSPEKLSSMVERGASVRHADFSHKKGLVDAMRGGNVLLLISTLSIGKRAEQHKRAMIAARAAGIGHIVYTSSMGIQPQTPSISGHEHMATELMLQKSGLKYTFLRNSWYADVSVDMFVPMLMSSGVLVASTGDGLVAPVAKDDCARIAAGVLRNPSKHENAIYEVTGPELLSFADIVKILGEECGRKFKYIDVSHAEKLKIFDAMGVNRDYEEGMMNEHTNAWASNEMITYEMAIKRQFFSICSNHVGLVTGKRPISIRDLYRERHSQQG
jgi:NAD(P)H dehydrogenase (quinone)